MMTDQWDKAIRKEYQHTREFVLPKSFHIMTKDDAQSTYTVEIDHSKLDLDRTPTLQYFDRLSRHYVCE